MVFLAIALARLIVRLRRKAVMHIDLRPFQRGRVCCSRRVAHRSMPDRGVVHLILRSLRGSRIKLLETSMLSSRIINRPELKRT